MKKLFPVLALLLSTACAFSQPADTGTPQPLDIEGERTRIQAERAREEAHYGQAEAACYARFVVTDCLRDVRVHRREALAKLRRQELALNDAERKRKALEQMERIEEKSSVQRREEASRLKAREDQQGREECANQKSGTSTKPLSTSP